MNKIDLSVIILSYNTRDLTVECLKSVKQAVEFGSKYKIEIIVVDNASWDGSPEYIAKKFPLVRLIVSRNNLGFSGGNNLGLKKASGRLVLFLNSDTQVMPETFKTMIEFFAENDQAGAVTPKTVLVSGKMDPDCHRGFPTPWASLTYFVGLEKIFPQSRIFGRYHQNYLNLNRIHEIEAGFGTFLMVRREVLDQIGGWDESYFFYGEDLDMFYRIKATGWKTYFYPKTLVRHYKGASSGLRKESKSISPADRQTRIKAARSSIKAMSIFYRKFYHDKYPFWLTGLVLLGIRIKGLIRLSLHYLKR